MKEIEAKILGVDQSSIEKSLKSLGAKKVFEGRCMSIRYDLKDRRLRKGKQHLRLRREGSRSFLTFKSSLSAGRAKVMRELEVDISDFDSMDRIISSLGFTHRVPYVKKRTSYVLGNVRFELDKCPGVPLYLEIEAPSTKLIENAARKLGIDASQLLPWTTKEVFNHYGKRFD